MKNTQFDRALQQLNPEQRHAVETIEGPVMVIAGPGTGKTQVLALRIAHILRETDTVPRSILALTFTEAAAKNMRARLTTLIGAAAYQVRIETFHAFCEDVIRSHPEYFALSRESQVCNDLDRHRLMEELLRSQTLHVLRSLNSPFHFLKQILKAISDLKREGVTEVQFAQLVAAEQQLDDDRENEDAPVGKRSKHSTHAAQDRRAKELQKMRELSVLYTEYQQHLRSSGRYDYDDMIAFVAEAFRTQPDLLAEYQENIAYFLVDEYQDTNAAQNGVVDILASYWGDQANLFVVGDPHQSIYRFQGASLENTLGFMARYPNAEIIRLTLGYRCPQSIYDAAAALIAQNGVGNIVLPTHGEWLTQLSAPLQSASNEKSDKNSVAISILATASAEREVTAVIQLVDDLRHQHVPLSEIAILSRTNAEARSFAEGLAKQGIPALVEGGTDILQHPVIDQLMTLWRAVADVRTNRENEKMFVVMMAPWWKQELRLPRQLVWQVTRAAGKSRRSIVEVIEAGASVLTTTLGTTVTPDDFSPAERLLEQLKRWGQDDATMTFPSWCEKVLAESGFLAWLTTHPERQSLIPLVNALYREVKALSAQGSHFRLDDFLLAVATMQENGISITVETPSLATQAVTLATVHKAKGREWSHVFLTGCVDGKWGNARKVSGLPLPAGILTQTDPADISDRNGDDRRLLYVALTRAKQHVTISYPEKTMSGNRERLLLRSMFLSELPEALVVNKAWEIDENRDAEASLVLLAPAPTPHLQDSEQAWLHSLVEDFSLSVTAFNTYLRSPEEFFINTLLRLPRAKPDYMAFGTAVHVALETMYRPVLTGQPLLPLAGVLEQFQRVLRKEILTDEEFDRRLRHGQKVLTAYYADAQNSLATPMALEQFFGAGPHQTTLDDIRLNGRIDRIDALDAARKTLRVIDYKTGQSKTLNQIEGRVGIDEFSQRELALPEPVRGPYKRQLLFYKLLTQLDAAFIGTVTEGSFIFVEPEESGKFVQRTFALLDEDVEVLKDLIRTVMAEIRSLEFLRSIQNTQ